MLYQSIKSEYQIARKECDTVEVDLFSTLIGDLEAQALRIRKNPSQSIDSLITDQIVLDTIKKYLKNIEETLGYLKERTVEETQEGFKDWAGKVHILMQEHSILQRFLPRQLSKAEMFRLINSVFGCQNGKPHIKDVMEYFKQNCANQYSPKELKEVFDSL